MDRQHRSIGWSICNAVAWALLHGTASAEPTEVPALPESLACHEGVTVQYMPLELSDGGTLLHASQLERIAERLNNSPSVRRVLVFLHGWNKNTASAAADYAELLCRLDVKIRGRMKVEGAGSSEPLVIAIYWPSSLTGHTEDPWVLMPLSYFVMRARADSLAERTIAPLFERLGPILERTQASLHLVGHSFGGRMIVGALETMVRHQKATPFLQAPSSFDIWLVNAAISPDRFDWTGGTLVAARDIPNISIPTSYLFNIHSRNDVPNRVLFPLAALFTNDQVSCAVGSCGVQGYRSVCVAYAGQIPFITPPTSPTAPATALHAFNVDATAAIAGHSDIYKEEVATLLSNLLSPAAKAQALYYATETGCAYYDKRLQGVLLVP